MQIAMGSASELEYLYMLTHDLGYLSDEQYASLSSDIIEIKKMLASFIKKLRTG
jgi:four helix bundle protein